MTSCLITTRSGAIVVVTLNRPSVLNALSRELRREFCTALQQLDDDPSVRAIILTGAGERAFTAGLDLTETADELPGTIERVDGANPVAAIEACSKPVIAAVNGLCITGGMEIALACDIVFASRTARFADTHVRVGLLPGWGLSQRLSRQIGRQRAKEISLSGNFVNADRAFALGLVNDVVDPTELMSHCLEFAKSIADADQDTVRAYSKLIDDGAACTFAEALELEKLRCASHASRLDAEDIANGMKHAQRLNRTQTL